MLIHYYKIRNCRFGYYECKPVLFPPEGTAPELLRQHGFVQTEEGGEWYCSLSAEEMRRIQAHEQDAELMLYPESAFSPELAYRSNLDEALNAAENRIANILSGMSLAIMTGTIWGVLWNFKENAEVPLWFGMTFILAVVIMVAIRIRFPQNHFGKVLMVTYIVIVVLAIVGLILLLIACSLAMTACFDSCCECAEGVGRIG